MQILKFMQFSSRTKNSFIVYKSIYKSQQHEYMLTYKSSVNRNCYVHFSDSLNGLVKAQLRPNRRSNKVNPI